MWPTASHTTYFHLNLLKTTTTIIFVKYICQWIKNLLLWNCVFLSSSPPVFRVMRICLFSLKGRFGRQYISRRYFGLLLAKPEGARVKVEESTSATAIKGVAFLIVRHSCALSTAVFKGAVLIFSYCPCNTNSWIVETCTKISLGYSWTKYFPMVNFDNWEMQHPIDEII